jgi:hypothetical protein
MKKKTNSYYFTLLMAGLLLMTSCYQATVEVRVIPGNTPPGDPIYITGNFNNWDPGDERYRLELQPDSIYSISLPRGFGRIDYKFTRGDWSTVEKDVCGFETANRYLFYGDDELIQDTVMSWRDLAPLNCPQVSIIINELPDNTPEDARITIAGSFNDWDAGNDYYTFVYDSLIGKYVITISREENSKTIRYKITRGSLLTEEVDELGLDIPPRSFTFGEADSIYISIKGWEDLGMAEGDYVTYIVNSIPDNTPPDDEIYYLGDINSWYPRDKSLILKKTADGNYSIRFPRDKQGATFKFSRGDWNSIEVDAYGYNLNNRYSYFGDEDTVYLQIDNWKDLATPDNSTIRINLLKVPENTPPGDDIYIAGNFNGWDPGSGQWKLQKNPESAYFIEIPRSGGTLEFKFTRGSWGTVESKNGRDIDNRTYLYRNVTQLNLQVDGWLDIEGE